MRKNFSILCLLAIVFFGTIGSSEACWRDRERRQPVRNVIRAVFGTSQSAQTYQSAPRYHTPTYAAPSAVQQTGGCSNGQCPVPYNGGLVRPTFTP